MLELRDLIVVLRRALPWLLLTAFLGALLGYGVARRDAQTPEAHVVVSLQFIMFDAVSADSPAYDGYYVVETERRFGEVLAQTLRDPNFRDAFSRGSGVSLERVERVSPLDYRVTFRGAGAGSPAAATALEEALVTTLRSFSERSGEPLRAVASVSDPLLRASFPVAPAGAVGAATGVILAVFGILLRHYFRQET